MFGDVKLAASRYTGCGSTTMPQLVNKGVSLRAIINESAAPRPTQPPQQLESQITGASNPVRTIYFRCLITVQRNAEFSRSKYSYHMPDIEICLGVICSTLPPLNKRGVVLALRSFISRLRILTLGYHVA